MNILRRLYNTLHSGPLYRQSFRLFSALSRLLIFLSGRRLHFGGDEKRRPLLLLTVAFGNAALIREQNIRLKHYVRDKGYLRIVADNSVSRSARREIAAVCRESGVRYVAVPHFLSRFFSLPIIPNRFSLSHATALNWAVARIISPLRPAVTALLDHDLMPTGEIDFAARLGAQPFYGALVERNGLTYLWPGYAIFRTDVLLACRPDFFPLYIGRTWLDVGGMLYRRLYCRYDMTSLPLTRAKTKRITVTPGLTRYNDILHTDCIDRFDGLWVHLVNGSNYTRSAKKSDMLRECLRLLRENDAKREAEENNTQRGGGE